MTSQSSKMSPITITENAAEHVKYLLEKRGKESLGLRIGVKSGGCSGFSYVVEYADEKGQFDEVVVSSGVTVLIDPKAIMYLLGTEMDYVEGDFKSGFIFNNPNEKNKCGCGKSFGV
jgi:iron-sulfur cluster assembly protein